MCHGAARRRRVPRLTILTVSGAPDYAFPHSGEDESRRLQLLEQRLDPLTKRRIQRLGVGKGARCLEIGGGRGSITRWLSEVVGPTGRVVATDLQLGFLTEIDASTSRSSGTTSAPARSARLFRSHPHPSGAHAHIPRRGPERPLPR